MQSFMLAQKCRFGFLNFGQYFLVWTSQLVNKSIISAFLLEQQIKFVLTRFLFWSSIHWSVSVSTVAFSKENFPVIFFTE